MKHSPGVTLLEVLISIAIFSVISVAATWLVFSSLNLRDQTLATTRTIESLRVFSHTFRTSVLGARTLTFTPTTLTLLSPSDCWSFFYSAATATLLYDHQTTPGCVPTANPSLSFFPAATQITNFSFVIHPLATGGRQVIASGDITTVLPFSSYQTTFAETVVNLID